MSKLILIVLAASASTILGIATMTPMLVATSTLIAGGALLLAILGYFSAAH